MILPPLDPEKIQERVSEIHECIAELKNLIEKPLAEFSSDKYTPALAYHYFWKSLEAILSAGTHILSRLPGGGRTKDYQDIIISLGNFDVIPKDFATKNKLLASYRNRMVHGYWKVSDEELYSTIKSHLEDLEQFCGYFLKFLRDKRGIKES